MTAARPGLLFDPTLMPLRRARAVRIGGDRFLHERAFADCLERIGAARREFHSAVIFGDAGDDWPQRLRDAGVEAVTSMAAGSPLLEDPDLCLSVGALDTAEPLPAVLAALRHMLAPDALFIGAFAGGNSLPALRAAMRAADEHDGGAAPHVHPRIDPPSFAALLGNAGFVMPVVDIDRVRLRYASLDALVRDLRAMATTNILAERPRRPILRRGLAAARKVFETLGEQGKTPETIEIIHFAAWTPPQKTAKN